MHALISHVFITVIPGTGRQVLHKQCVILLANKLISTITLTTSVDSVELQTVFLFSC